MMNTDTSGTSVPAVAPKPKINGINVPQDVYDDMEAILRIEGRLHDLMGGGGHGASRSDIVSRALRGFIEQWKKELDLPLDTPVPNDPTDMLVRKAGEQKLNALRSRIKKKS